MALGASGKVLNLESIKRHLDGDDRCSFKECPPGNARRLANLFLTRTGRSAAENFLDVTANG